MRVFVTGATGFVGSAVVQELIAHGHRVLGLSRSDAGAGQLEAAGAEVARGTLDDHDVLARAAAGCDGVIHTAFNHDFSKFAENARQDRRAIEVLGGALEGTTKPILVTSGTAMLAQGRVATEADRPSGPSPRMSESGADDLVAKGVRASVVRLAPTTHGAGDHGFVPMLIALAREKGVAAYIGEGNNRWSAVHRSDAARLYRLAIERGAGGERYHAVAEEAVLFKDIAAAIGKGLSLPVESRPSEHFGWFAMFAGMDAATSAAWTREALGWTPIGPSLAEDLENAAYF
ncbi:SDR family oxidoreductase [Caulobacter sp. 602-1]|uniref:SDR family oxidoreductase n=1 Tax=Caulobacter sp. 602-1 TaxID=2492472 RepID=UPI000F644CBA|nr:SDR family oxidoreductase [Caulobacter sp. 602-1]RRN65501.1 SDR family oxidoreductase [Caulobacter sp. 602-1]